MKTYLYRLFKKDKANVTLLAIVCLLLCTIGYKEIEFQRWKRYHYGVLILQTPGVTNYLYYLAAWSDKDSYYDGVGIGNQRIGDYYFDCERSDKLNLPPDKMSIKWTSVSDSKRSWMANIDLNENYLKRYHGDQFAVRLHKDGKVTLYVTNAVAGRSNMEKEHGLKGVGIFQADMVEPEKMIADVVKELLYIAEMNPTKKEMNDSISETLNDAIDIFLAGTSTTNDVMKARISSLLREDDTVWFEDTQEARRIKKRRANCWLALALLSDEEERDESMDKAYQCAGGVGWGTEDKELADVYLGIRLMRLLFQLQEDPFNVSHSLFGIGEYLRESEAYMTKEQYKHCDEVVEFCLRYYY